MKRTLPVCSECVLHLPALGLLGEKPQGPAKAGGQTDLPRGENDSPAEVPGVRTGS